MPQLPSRRAFFRTGAAASATFSLEDLSLLSALPVAQLQADWNPNRVQFEASIEPLVQLLETTARAKLLPAFAERIRAGTTYAQILSALHLAGIRNIPPRPSVGFKFHAVLVVNSIHLATLEVLGEDRWLPIFWALDFFKSRQVDDEHESEWSMPALAPAEVPSPTEAREAFRSAMDAWDSEAADIATAGLVHTSSKQDLFDIFVYYGMRDFRDIGHKPIHMANSWRTLEFIGWQHAEPMLRSLSYAFLNHEGAPNPSTSELEADAPWRHNLKLVNTIKRDWQDGEAKAEVSTALLQTLRAGTWSAASDQVAQLLQAGEAPQTIIDALFAAAAELLIRQPSIISVHAMTSTNALMYALRHTSQDHNRRLLLLQNAAFLVQFREYMAGNGSLSDDTFDSMQAAELDAGEVPLMRDIFEQLTEDPGGAASSALAFLQDSPERAKEFIQGLRHHIARKCRNGHDYKFTSAVIEDYLQLSSSWSNQYLASSVYYLPGSDASDSRTLKRTRAALEG